MPAPLKHADVLRSNIPYATRICEIAERVGKYASDADIERIHRAYVFAARAHGLQKRKSGELFITHPLAVAGLLAYMKMDIDTVITGLLHDTVEDTNVTLKEISEHFGSDVAYLVDGVTKLASVDELTPRQIKEAENIRKMVLAMANDIRVLFVKLADRLHNMSTLDSMPKDRARVKARECQELYAPLANRLGIYWIKQALQDLAFFTLDQERYCELRRLQDERIKALEHTPDEIANRIREKVCSHIEDVKVDWRAKHIYSLHQKLEEKHISFDQINDVLAFRVIVPDTLACYQALGVIHGMYQYHIGSFKDYISTPKGNGYKSLHTTVFIDGQRTEIQIRSQDMHFFAENGLAAHWLYKERKENWDERKDKQPGYHDLAWLKSLAEHSVETSNPLEFMENLRLDLFIQEVFVFSRDGELYPMPRNATALDFAYAIHTNVGHQCVGARVNGGHADLTYVLRNGDHVEIITNPEQSPSMSWLNIVRTRRARHAIRQFFRKQDQRSSILLGEKLLSEIDYPDDIPPSILQQLSCGSLDELKERLGRGETSIDQLLQALYGKDGAWDANEIGKHMFHTAKCCHPVPGDPVRARILKGRGIELHTSDCKRVQCQQQIEWRAFEWPDIPKRLYPATIYMKVRNLRGMLSRIANAISCEQANIEDIRMNQMTGGIARLCLLIEVQNLAQLQAIIRELRDIDGVIQAQRNKDDQDGEDKLMKLSHAVVQLHAQGNGEDTT